MTTQGNKKPSPSPTRRISQPNPPASGYGGAPVRVRRGSNPATPTGVMYKPIHEQPSSAPLPVAVSDQRINSTGTPTRYPRPRIRNNHHSHHNSTSTPKKKHHHCHKRGDSFSRCRQRDYSSESELKIIEENIVSWDAITASKASYNKYGIHGLLAQQQVTEYHKPNFPSDIGAYHQNSNVRLTENSLRTLSFLQHHGSLDRKCVGDLSSFLSVDDDDVFHPSSSSRLLG